MRLRSTLMATAMLGLPALASAQPVNGLYVGAGAGGNILQNESIQRSRGPVNFGRGSDYKFDAGPVVIGSVGYGLGNGLRLELQGAYYQNKINRLANGGARVPGLGTGRETSAGGDEYKEGVFGNVLYDIPLNSFGLNAPVFPYVGVGVGYVHNQFNNGHTQVVSNLNGASTQFLRITGQNDNLGVQGIVGVSYPVDAIVPGLAFTAEYRFMAEPFFDRTYKGQYDQGALRVRTAQRISDDFNHSFLLGVRYAFKHADACAGGAADAGAGHPAGPHLPGVLRLGPCGPDGPCASDRVGSGAGQHPRAVHADRSAGQRRPLRHAGLQPASVAASCADRGGRAGA